MPVSKIILYYAFAPLADPDAVRLWQRDLAESLGLRGRILVSEHGLNGTLGGPMAALKRYVRKTREYAAFRDIDFKWSDGSELDGDERSSDFPKLSVKVREEVVSFGAPGELEVDAHGVVGGGTHLSPDALHQLVSERGDDVVFFDGRNALEAAIGRFAGAVVPNVETTRDFVRLLDSGEFDELKNRPVVTYCTGGIRCEVLSSLMVSRGFDEVYQLDGGIVRYGERFRDKGLWEGSLYVFDKRGSIDFSDDAATMGECSGCGAATKRTANCSIRSCDTEFVVCDACTQIPCVVHN
ncbi:rhodanese-related sulfurtransferase [Microbacterium sp. NPDC076911]|uniref:oxygen-dependent tRNA uridine(34) hydroxylase TrhO n=1 Tax=Microbacterium sp. NPDC076911 TaxID=3154958 RepID=UPI0034177A65